MKRLFTFWRIVALLALALAAWAIFGGPPDPSRAPHVARLDISGVIASDPERERILLDLARDPDVKALILRIDSPGGTVVGSEELYDAIRKVAEAKPVVAQMGGLAASGGYIAAIAADHIVARRNTVTGSIGVVKQDIDVRGLLDTLGVQVTEQRSDVYKAQPSPFSPPPPEVVAWEKVMIEDAYDWFRGLVGERRGLDAATLDKVADGRVFSGHQALERGLVDEIGGPEAARAWLTAQGVGADLPAVDANPKRDRLGIVADLLDSALPTGETALMKLNRLTSGPRLYSILP